MLSFVCIIVARRVHFRRIFDAKHVFVHQFDVCLFFHSLVEKSVSRLRVCISKIEVAELTGSRLYLGVTERVVLSPVVDIELESAYLCWWLTVAIVIAGYVANACGHHEAILRGESIRAFIFAFQVPALHLVLLQIEQCLLRVVLIVWQSGHSYVLSTWLSISKKSIFSLLM